ncbi:regulation of nuclear pre-mRNA domain-containing protein 2a [Xyrichtys novacula]|uniref:Regulation of nuclear pre-mRNA domain-containing protein 2 n=1 Tax=Xyrichtys novacula TaxID=13765 RepID=A0AAV1HF18_XYRNO|nr:regulation of nuclear pre-mRNA domain-containing protein 2a [Xyrichtys novacula]
MAAGGSIESTLDRKFQTITNTMDSIQGLSTWCIDNKKYHSLIVRYWMKTLKKSESSHRLNLIYLANDIIQNCKRKNAIVYRTAFADVLRDAFLLVSGEGDQKVIKSAERILSIWEDRAVYSGTLITELRNSLVREESPPETPVEQKTPVESKADLRSKVLAEFVPQALLDQLSKYKRSLEDVDLREKQLAAMRVDICSSEALRKLKDKAGGKKFSKDFEEGSAQLQEFVKFLDKESKKGPPLMEALSNADVFYEMQYKEVKIVANAYQTFANRVSHLKRKLDALKATLPDLDESPIPSPSADAPSPTGSESPFHGMELAHPDPDLDGSAMDDDAEPPAPSPLSSLGGSPRPADPLGDNDKLEVEDMDLSDEEMDGGGIIVEEQIGRPSLPAMSTSVPVKTEPSVVTEQPVTQATPPVAAPTAAVESVDLGKIGSIISSLNSVMKNTGPVVESPPPAASSSLKTTPAAPLANQDASSLVNLLSKVDVSPADILGALSKVQGKSSLDGISSLLSTPAVTVSSDSSNTGKIPPSPSPSSTSTSASTAPSQSLSLSSVAPVPSSLSSTVRQGTSSQTHPPPQTPNPASALVQALHRDMDLITDPEPSTSSQSLESKIHNFLQGNSAFSAFDLGFSSPSVQGGDNLSPAPEPDTQEGTPVRDEGGGTPTQDEIMDKPGSGTFASGKNQTSSVGETFDTGSIVAQKNLTNPQQQAHLQPGGAQNGQVYQQYQYGAPERPERGMTTPVAHYQQVSTPTGGPVPGERAPGGASSIQTAEGFQMRGERGWYGDIYPEGVSQQPRGYNIAAPGENQPSGVYPYQTGHGQKPPGFQQGPETTPGFFANPFPPVPKLPPQPHRFEAPPGPTNHSVIPREQQPMPPPDAAQVIGPKTDSVISGMVVHDHQHKSMFHQDEPTYQRDQTLRPHSDEPRYHDDHRHDAPFFQNDPYHHQEDPYYRPASPSHHYPRVRGRLTPPLSPSEDQHYGHGYQRHSPPPPPHFAPRRPPPPHHLEIRHPGLRPPQRPPLRPPLRPPYSAHPRGPPGPPRPPRPSFPPQFHHGPDPRLRGKRPVQRGGMNAGPMFPPKRPFPPPRY